MNRLFIFFLLFLTSGACYAQNTATLYGSVKDSSGRSLPGVAVAVAGIPGGAISDEKGAYTIEVPADTEVIVNFSSIGLITEKIILKLGAGEKKELNQVLRPNVTVLPSVEITVEKTRREHVTELNPKVLSTLPNPSGNFESILKTLPGVSSSNELSSQYSVRGGNYDENLVYVNDVEVYRPFLIRSGQQEGLSFINSEMVSSVSFSAGGFDAKYGDKMSSVLDIKYKKPEKFAATVEASLLGGNLNLEGASKNKRLTFLAGVRQKSNQYVLSSLDTKGDYRPSFTDVQSYLTYALTPKWEVAFLGNYSRNLYRIIPENRETSFGTVNEALRLTVFFDGQELDSYETFTGALTTTFQPNNRLRLKLIGSSYKTFEKESFDIMGQYSIDELEKDPGKPAFGDIKSNLGYGAFIDHARTTLDALVYNFEHKGYYSLHRNYLQWGIKYQTEVIDDKLSEWDLLDSAGYSLPKTPGYYFPVNSREPVLLREVVRTKVHLASNRYAGYLQNTFTFGDGKIFFTAGMRATYWDLNGELNLSPRATLSYKPAWKRDMVFRASAGVYFQPPFYRELRDLQGKINRDLKAQQSIHLVIGSDYNFRLWGRSFKYVTEAYYKDLRNLVPYKIDNVRIRYLANNNSHGYARGLDMRINGEFVNGIESWATVSLLQTKEDIGGDYYYIRFNAAGDTIIPGYTQDQKAVDSLRKEPGYIPRPTDQFLTFSIFFQDYLPKHPSYKIHLNLVFGSGLPFGPPTNEKYRDTLRMPQYRRVDIGFSKQIIGEKSKLPPNMRFLKYIKSMWFSLEVFNLLQVSNTVSYFWLLGADSQENPRYYAVPNYLTARQLNARLVMRF